VADNKVPGVQLDATQYQADAIAKYEAVYGDTLSARAARTAPRACIARLGLKPGMRVRMWDAGSAGRPS